MARTAPAAGREVKTTDNGPPEIDPDLRPASDVGGVAGKHLRSFIERIERLNEEKRSLADDIKEVKAEAKGAGFDVKVITALIKIRAADQDDLDEFEAMLDTYKRAIGMSI